MKMMALISDIKESYMKIKNDNVIWFYTSRRYLVSFGNDKLIDNCYLRY